MVPFHCELASPIGPAKRGDGVMVKCLNNTINIWWYIPYLCSSFPYPLTVIDDTLCMCFKLKGRQLTGNKVYNRHASMFLSNIWLCILLWLSERMSCFHSERYNQYPLSDLYFFRIAKKVWLALLCGEQKIEDDAQNQTKSKLVVTEKEDF